MFVYASRKVLIVEKYIYIVIYWKYRVANIRNTQDAYFYYYWPPSK